MVVALRLSGNLIDFMKPISTVAAVRWDSSQLTHEVLSKKDYMGKAHLFLCTHPQFPFKSSQLPSPQATN